MFGSQSIAHTAANLEWSRLLPGIDRLWAITTGHPDINIAVLDGPTDLETLGRTAFIPSGTTEHGTFVCSVIGGSRDVSTPGIAPGCTILPIAIFRSDSDGNQYCSQSDLADGIEHAMALHAQVINVSASQKTELTNLSSRLATVIDEALRRDILIVAASGNDGCACDTLPAAIPGVLAVGAHDDLGIPLPLSNWGQNHRSHGVVAPGRNVPGACLGGGLCRSSGTSFSTAAVSAVAGLMMSAETEAGIAPSGARIAQIIVSSCAELPSTYDGLKARGLAGRLDVGKAIDLLIGSRATIARQEDSVNNVDTQTASITVADHSDVSLVGEPAGSPSSAGTANLDAKPQQPLNEGVLQLAGDCGCASCSGAKKTQLVYAIGRLGVSFPSIARRDSIWRSVNGQREGDLKPISNEALKDLFQNNPFQAQSVYWTLNRTEQPLYVIAPMGAYAAEIYKWLVNEWADPAVEFVSIPGVLAGQTTLYEGQLVDVVVPDLRGMYSWETQSYVQQLRSGRRERAPDSSDSDISVELERFLGKIYYSVRNKGLTAEERAINAAATNAFNFSTVIEQAGRDGLTLRDISTEKSPINRAGSEFYDVLLTFFNPRDRQGMAPLRARFTIDVGDTVPVMIGDPVLWYEY